MQWVFVFNLKLYNALAAKTGLLNKKIAGSCGCKNTISPSADIDFKHAVIGNFCQIGNRVIVGKNTVLGNNVIIGSGTIIGSEGFEIRRIRDELIPVVHVGGVTIHNNVVIGSHVCIDKSLFGDFTEIMENSRIDDYVHVAHGVTIGRCCSIAASVMIGGKVIIGDNVRIGLGAKISDQITIGDGATISMGSVVTKDVLPGQRVTGNFAISHEKFIKHFNEIS
jgi:UDP-3-O-[3-hydroxymyristoyl] glucosamine N-acyltransferase